MEGQVATTPISAVGSSPDRSTVPGSPRLEMQASQIPPPIQIPSGFFSTALKLDEGNYSLWKGQVLTAMIAGGYEDFVYGLSQPPPKFSDDQQQVINPEYKVWQRTDKSVKKEGKSMQQYLNTVKMFSDQLSAIGETVKYKDYLWYLLEGLPAEYDPVVTAVYSRPDQPSIDEIHQLLLNFEIQLEKRHVQDCALPQVQYSSLAPTAGSGSAQPSPPLPHLWPSKSFSDTTTYDHHTATNPIPNYRQKPFFHRNTRPPIPSQTPQYQPGLLGKPPSRPPFPTSAPR